MKIEFVLFIYIGIGLLFFIIEVIKISLKLRKNGFDATYLEYTGRGFNYTLGGEDSPTDLFGYAWLYVFLWPIALYFSFFCRDEISGKNIS
ncbi:MAG: hypothetical protein WC791_00695 [Candidatus Paceibacterota bacterium]|jgi:hypothetical protein